ncbi:hypothetical protein [Halioxenophilus sp. WMMB6]|uniref:hypothetical protein n=1 Tax=Halioxenophilus sp. WMMB6 TaxID=3073815 RepID=UPI00295F23A2|nr:hypothetical protein [Halioxenophilus sp. WMMB6]
MEPASAVVEESEDTSGEASGLLDDAQLLERMSTVDLVMAVRVDVALEQINLALSRDGNYVSEGVRYGVTVDAVWKGSPLTEQGLVYFNVPLNKCYRTMLKNSDYLLLVNTADDGTIRIESCDDIVPREVVSDQFAAIATQAGYSSTTPAPNSATDRTASYNSHTANSSQ